MENSTFIFPTSQLITANPLLFSSFNPLVNHSALNSLSQKRSLNSCYSNIHEDLEPVKKHFKPNYAFAPVKSTQEQPIVIDDSDEFIIQPVGFAQNNNLENLLQLSLLQAYLDQLEQAKQIERQYSLLCTNYALNLSNQGPRDSDMSTNDSEVESISNPQSPIYIQESPSETMSEAYSTYIEMDSDDEYIDIEEKPVVIEGSDLLADIPKLEKKSLNKNARTRGLKLVWNPTEKVEDIEQLIKELEECLGVTISNQERVCKLYSANGFSISETVKTVMEDRSKYRFELKDKRAVVSKKNKSK